MRLSTLRGDAEESNSRPEMRSEVFLILSGVFRVDRVRGGFSRAFASDASAVPLAFATKVSCWPCLSVVSRPRRGKLWPRGRGGGSDVGVACGRRGAPGRAGR